MVIFLSQFINVLFSQSTYEEIRLNASDVGDKMKYLKEGMDCIVLFWNGKVFAKSITLCTVFSLLSLTLFVLMLLMLGIRWNIWKREWPALCYFGMEEYFPNLFPFVLSFHYFIFNCFACKRAWRFPEQCLRGCSVNFRKEDLLSLEEHPTMNCSIKHHWMKTEQCSYSLVSYFSALIFTS